jgi:hypothetical protein
MKIRREERSKCTCGRPALVVCGTLEVGALSTSFNVGLCLKSGGPISECRLALVTKQELESMEAEMRQQPF